MKKRIQVVELGNNTLDNLTIKAFNALSKAEVVVLKGEIDGEIIDVINKRASIECIATNSISFIAATQASEIVLVTNTDPYDLPEIVSAVEMDWTIEIIPSVKQFLSALAVNKIPITKRGSNLGFLVIREKMDHGNLLKHLDMAIETNASLVLMENFSMMDLIIHRLTFLTKSQLPIAVGFNREGNFKWIAGIIDTISEEMLLEQVPENAIIYIGEAVKQLGKLENIDAKSLLMDKF